MINPKKIENLDPATNLQDDDLLFASVPNGVSAYVSKKVTLANIANYVRNGMQPIEPGFGGYEIYDLSDEEGDGRCYNQADVEAYCADSSRNLLFDLDMYTSSATPATTFTVKTLEKTVSKNCLVELEYWNCLPYDATYSAGDLYDYPNSSRSYSVYINDKLLRLQNFFVPEYGVKLYLKAGQTIKINVPDNIGGGRVSIIPLKSGCRFFIDTDKDDSYFPHGYMSDLRDTNAANYTYTYTNDFDCPILFCSRFRDSVTGHNTSSDDDVLISLNGKYIHYDAPDQSNSSTCVCSRIILMPGDVFKAVRYDTSYGKSLIHSYNVYPLVNPGIG